MTTNIFWFFGFGVCFEMGKKPALYFPSLREQRGLIGHWRSMFFETCLLKINFGTCTNWLENIGQPFLSFFLVLSLSLFLYLFMLLPFSFYSLEVKPSLSIYFSFLWRISYLNGIQVWLWTSLFIDTSCLSIYGNLCL